MRGRSLATVAGGLALSVVLFLAAGRQESVSSVLWRDDLSQGAWRAAPAAGVELATGVERRGSAAALRLEFDFQGRGGWAAARREVGIDLPENWELRFSVRGSARPNHLEIKFIDPSGENVWWSVKRDFSLPAEPALVRIRKRQVSFAWGPAGGGELKRLAALEVAITAGEGGHGTAWLSDIELRSLPPERPYAGTPRLAATVERIGGEASLALDGRPDTAWRTGAIGAAPAELTIDFGQARIFGGVTLNWEAGRAPRRLALDLREERDDWREVRRIDRGGGSRTDVLLPDTEAAALRVRILEAKEGAALSELIVRPLEFGASPNAFFEAIASESPQGVYPRGFSGEQAFWTIAGVDGDTEETLLSEDGSIEIGGTGMATLGPPNPSLEPFLWMGGRLWTWRDRAAVPALLDGDLPIPLLTWQQQGMRIGITSLATGRPGDSLLAVRYVIQNGGASHRAGRFFLAARPFQVNPPSQFLNRTGGVAPIRSIHCRQPGLLSVQARSVFVSPPSSACGAAAFDEGPITDWLARGEVPATANVEDATGYASGALAWDYSLEPGEQMTVIVAAPFHYAGATAPRRAAEFAAPRAAALFRQILLRERAAWRERLDRVRLELPPDARELGAVVRSSLAWILVNRDGPAIQPGSRAYERSWIRDGTLTSAALLRLGHADEARAFAEWFAGFQYPDGRVPCCVDRRGADPVPEHDSHGEFIHLVSQIARFTNDPVFAARLFPNVERAVSAIDTLRQQRRTREYRSGDKAMVFGLLPESISHEGYSAKPMHSYWDDGWAVLGLEDAVRLADVLGRADAARKFAASRDELQTDVRRSIERVRAAHQIDYLPGAADLGDFDSTSTTVMLDPVGLDGLLGREPFVATFERYEREVRERIAGTRAWDAYTPYEVRHIGAFVRMGWRERAQVLLRAFLADRRPPGWNQFPEVVTREVRKPRFLGDLPHGWVASDFIRSALDLFAYERHSDSALMLAAGIPGEWLANGRRIAVQRLRTAWGALSYDLTESNGTITMHVQTLERWPPGGVKLALPVSPGAAARVDGRVVTIEAGGVIGLSKLPATIEVKTGQ